ncbi:putative addiction module antidote protein [Herbaspirillum rubrisubalbicans]|uniref:addiction module antidote protein n=1 Tax=Herbaspirillum rubrisubalbicans TaxID=80842 RepID=UPI002583D7B2|nr:addiction module antidote protein [Herbaspirillum rubrisubalbicans]MCP1574723.1 putative addiction module antidote protein [Herbaspirillum rubrisubalbicans]
MTNRKFSAKDLQVSVFDPVDYLDSDEAMAAYIEAAFEENDPAFLMAALSDVIRARGIAEVAGKAGLGRESLYKTLKPGAEPRLDTVLRLLGALNLRLSIVPENATRKAKKPAAVKPAPKDSSGKKAASPQPVRSKTISKKRAVPKRSTKTTRARSQIGA